MQTTEITIMASPSQIVRTVPGRVGADEDFYQGKFGVEGKLFLA